MSRTTAGEPGRERSGQQSMRVLRRIGFRAAEKFVQDFVPDGVERPRRSMAILRSDQTLARVSSV